MGCGRCGVQCLNNHDCLLDLVTGAWRESIWKSSHGETETQTFLRIELGILSAEMMKDSIRPRETPWFGGLLTLTRSAYGCWPLNKSSPKHHACIPVLDIPILLTNSWWTTKDPNMGSLWVGTIHLNWFIQVYSNILLSELHIIDNYPCFIFIENRVNSISIVLTPHFSALKTTIFGVFSHFKRTHVYIYIYHINMLVLSLLYEGISAWNSHWGPGADFCPLSISLFARWCPQKMVAKSCTSWSLFWDSNSRHSQKIWIALG